MKVIRRPKSCLALCVGSTSIGRPTAIRLLSMIEVSAEVSSSTMLHRLTSQWLPAQKPIKYTTSAVYKAQQLFSLLCIFLTFEQHPPNIKLTITPKLNHAGLVCTIVRAVSNAFDTKRCGSSKFVPSPIERSEDTGSTPVAIRGDPLAKEEELFLGAPRCRV